METKFIEVTNGPRNWGKFLLLRFDEEFAYPSEVMRQHVKVDPKMAAFAALAAAQHRLGQPLADRV